MVLLVDLSEYVKAEGRGVITRISKESGVSVRCVQEAIKGTRWVHDRTRKLISEATGGVVPPEKVGRCW